MMPAALFDLDDTLLDPSMTRAIPAGS